MADTQNRAVRRRQLRISPLWLLPLVALGLGAWMAYERFADRGPTVFLRMPEAEGVEAGKTLVKARDVEVGQVKDVRLSDDLGHTVVEAQLRHGAERMLNETTQFWVVKPRIGSRGISGLNTVLSGSYIALRPGDSQQTKRRFDVLEDPPVTGPGDEGLRIKLVGGLDSGLTAGDPVTYHGMTVGRVASIQLNTQTRRIEHQVFIEAPYTGLITAQTRFWNAAGLRVSYDADGFSADFQSMETLLGGGVSLSVPDDNRGESVDPKHRFRIHPSRAAARDASFEEYLEYVVLVEESVEGVREGAPVKYRGVRIGTVDTVAWRFEGPRPNGEDSLAVPLLVRIEPRRLAGVGEELVLEDWRERITGLINDGLRASVQSQSFITGVSYVSLDIRGEAGPIAGTTYGERPVIPATVGGVGRLQDQMSKLLAKINDLEMQSVLTKLEGSAASSQATFRSVQRTADSIRGLLDAPATRELPGQMDKMLAELRRTLAGFNRDSQLYQQLSGLLNRLDSTIKDVQPLVRTLREQPNALIFDKENIDDPEPKAPR